MVLFLLLSCGCFLSEGDDHPNKDPIEPPPDNIQATYDTVYYLPESATITSSTPVCSIDVITHMTLPKPIEENFVDFVYDEVDFNEDVEFDDFYYKYSDHIHTRSIDLELSGGNFDFLAWIKIEANGKLVAWGGPFEDGVSRISLKVDGSVDLLSIMDEPILKLKGRIRAKSPDEDSTITGYMSFSRFYNCES